MSADYACCVIGGGLLARLWAKTLTKHGLKTLIIASAQKNSGAPPYLALTQKSVATLEHFGFSVPGTPIKQVALYDGSELLQKWRLKNANNALGLHVARSDLEEQAQLSTLNHLEAAVISMTHDCKIWQLQTSTGTTLSAHLCFDFTGLQSPMRFALQRSFAYLELEAFQARIFKGIFPSLSPDTAYQFKLPSCIWAFLPLEGKSHYVVQTWNPKRASMVDALPPVDGSATLLSEVPAQPLAAIKHPYHRFGALVGGSAYMGHPNVAATFNIGLWQLRLMEPILFDKKNELLLFNEWNCEFDAQVLWLKKISGAAGSSLRTLLPFLGASFSKALIESLS